MGGFGKDEHSEKHLNIKHIPRSFSLFWALIFLLPTLNLFFTREETSGVFKEGVKPAEAPVRTPLSGGKICSCHEKTTVW